MDWSGPPGRESLLASKRRKTHTRIIREPRSKRALSHVEKIEFISKREHVRDASSARSVTLQYKRLKSFPLHLRRDANKAQRTELKIRGFYTNSRGVIIDGPRDTKRQPIKGAKFQIQKNGVIKWTVKQRQDYIIGFTKKEKKQFALDPEGFVKKKLAELKKSHPSLKGLKRKPQVRLQWGAYQHTKDFSPTQFGTKYLTKHAPREKMPRLDKLTGLHIVIHVPRKKGKRGKYRRS